MLLEKHLSKRDCDLYQDTPHDNVLDCYKNLRLQNDLYLDPLLQYLATWNYKEW